MIYFIKSCEENTEKNPVGVTSLFLKAFKDQNFEDKIIPDQIDTKNLKTKPEKGSFDKILQEEIKENPVGVNSPCFKDFKDQTFGFNNIEILNSQNYEQEETKEEEIKENPVGVNSPCFKDFKDQTFRDKILKFHQIRFDLSLNYSSKKYIEDSLPEWEDFVNNKGNEEIRYLFYIKDKELLGDIKEQILQEIIFFQKRHLLDRENKIFKKFLYLESMYEKRPIDRHYFYKPKEREMLKKIKASYYVPHGYRMIIDKGPYQGNFFPDWVHKDYKDRSYDDFSSDYQEVRAKNALEQYIIESEKEKEKAYMLNHNQQKDQNQNALN